MVALVSTLYIGCTSSHYYTGILEIGEPIASPRLVGELVEAKKNTCFGLLHFYSKSSAKSSNCDSETERQLTQKDILCALHTHTYLLRIPCSATDVALARARPSG